MQREVCWQCGKPATELLWYYQGGKGWIQRPVCQMGDAHPWDVWVPANVGEAQNIAVVEANDAQAPVNTQYSSTSGVAQ